MAHIFDRYFELEENKAGCTHLHVYMWYNVSKGRPDLRGYYLEIKPIERKVERGFAVESYTLLSGTRVCCAAVSRSSKKGEQEALDFAKKYGGDYIRWLLEARGLKLKDEGVLAA